MDLITADHVRDLEAAAPGAALIVTQGRAQVVPRRDARADGYLVIGREDLQGLMTSATEQRSYDEVARSLNSAVIELGG